MGIATNWANIRMASLVLILISIILGLWAIFAVGVFKVRILPDLRKGAQLVTHGPYKLVRHPMYSAYTFWFLSWFLVSTNILFAISWVLWLVYLFIRIPQEEQMMLEQFGDPYREYMSKTGRLFPRF